MFGEMPDPTGDQFNDASIAGLEAGLEFVREGLAQLRTYDLNAQSFEGQTASNILEWYMDNQVRSEEFMLHPYVVFPGFGVQNGQVAFMTDTHEVHSRQDAENYISRLGLFMEKFHQVHLVMIEQERRGIVLPKDSHSQCHWRDGAIHCRPCEREPPLYFICEKAGRF